ncbi:GDSL esterase/lipase-like protein [Tanacetum coccineum]|uniref:GDSL esterase/lipase-like protein n=1 Tax=Tanacetum coccineum TaxID=301880 RepID=A0ABQ5FTI7_9ASTR
MAPSHITLTLFLFIVAVCASEDIKVTRNTYTGFRPTKLFVFGDSYSDTGNNPKSLASSWKTPYGFTFPGKPAGRYSDGRVLTDYVARFMGIKSPLPYRVTKYAPSKLRAGINFAFGGTGVFDTGNFQPNLTTQIGYLQGLIKDSVYTKRDLKSSLAMVTVSGNDYSAFTASGGSQQNLPAFITSVVNQMTIDLKRIHDLGIPRVLVNTLQPVGCLPQLTVLSAYQQCNQTQNSLASFHNQLLQLALTTLNNNTKKSTFLPLDLFTSFNTVLKNKGDITGNLKFDTPLKPCCTATTSTASCGSLDENGKPLYTVCSEPESMFFWDTVHPTQAGWRAVRDSTDGMTDLDDMDDIEMIMQQLQSEQEQQQAAERVHRRNYIYRERFDAEEHLMADYSFKTLLLKPINMSDSTDGMTDLDDMDDTEMIMQQLHSEQEQQEAAERVHRRNISTIVNVSMLKNI